MDNLYKNDFEFLDLSNLDDHGREEIAAILTSRSTASGGIKLPWDEEEIRVEYQEIPQEVQPPTPEMPKQVWQPYEMENEMMKYEAHPAANPPSSVYVTMPSTIQYSPQIMTPVYPEWPPANMYISNIPADPNAYMQGMAYPTNIYSPTETQEIPSMRDVGGRRGGRGRINKAYVRNMNHTTEMQTNYTSDPGQYYQSMPYHQPSYICISEPVTSQPHPAAGQPIFFPPHTTMYSPPMAQQTHRVDYIPPYQQQTTTNPKYNRPTPSLIPQTNGETTKSTNHKPFERVGQNVNIMKPSIHHQQTVDEDNSSPQTNIVTTVIVNNSNIESSNTDVDENPTAINNANNKQFDLKIEQRIVSTRNDKGAEKSDISCVNIKSSIEVTQNGNDNKECEETISYTNAPIINATPKPITLIKAPEQQIEEVQETPKIEIKPETIEVPVSSSAAAAASTSNKSWASLLKTNADPYSPSTKPTAAIAPNVISYNNNSDQTEQSPIDKIHLKSNQIQPLPAAATATASAAAAEESQKKQEKRVIPIRTESRHCDDPVSYRMGEFFLVYQMEKQTVSLLPRGLTNRSNYCYINSILQALLACPPFYNLFMAMPNARNLSRDSPSPLIDNMIKFVREFTPLSEGARLPRKDRSQKRNEDAIVDIQSGIPFEPSYIYNMMRKSSSSGVFSVEGRQEDAEEFLSCLLNGISDEMLELMKVAASNEQKSMENLDSNVNYNEEEEEWKVMGPKNKGSITRSTDIARTPLSDIFRGQLRSRVSRATEEPTDYVQPFFTLQLDIEKAESVKTALEILVGKDQLEGMTCSKTKQQIEAWKQVTLEELPVILILHLKWFDYKPDGCSKILKSVEFPIDLKIDKKLMSNNAKQKLSPKQKQYKLFAVTYHDGKEATKGHYVTDAFHVGYGGWVRYDDSSLRGVSEANVLNPSSPRVPYLLYYRRCDTIGNNQSNTVKAQ